MINRIVRLSQIDAAHRPLRLSWQTLQSRIYRSATLFFRPSLILLHEIVLTHLNVCLLGRLSGKPLVEGVQVRNWSLIDASKLFLAGKLSSTNNWQFDLGWEGASSFSKWSLSRLGCGPAQTIPLCWHVIETIRKKVVFIIYLTLPKGSNKFDCLIKEILFIRKFKPFLNVQADSIRAKVFTWRTCDPLLLC